MSHTVDVQIIVEKSYSQLAVHFQGHVKGVFPVLFIALEPDSPSVFESNGNENGNTGDDGDRSLGFRGDLIVTGSFDCTARSWDLVSGRCLKVSDIKSIFVKISNRLSIKMMA